jgi:hypothetical protein
MPDTLRLLLAAHLLLAGLSNLKSNIGSQPASAVCNVKFKLLLFSRHSTSV